MPNKLFCGCCGCLLFTAENFFAFEDVEVIEGWTVAKKTLPATGHYSISSTFAFRGLVPEEYRVELGLMKADGTFFSTWFYDGSLEFQEVPADLNEPWMPNYAGPPNIGRGPTHTHDGEWSKTWPEITLQRIRVSNETFVVLPSESSTNGYMDDDDDPYQRKPHFI